MGPSNTTPDPTSQTTGRGAPAFAAAATDANSSGQAVEQVVRRIADQLAGRIDLLVAFATGHHSETLYTLHDSLTGELAPRISVGMTAEGVIGTQCEIERRAGLSVLACQLPGVEIEPFTYDQIDWQAATQHPESLAGMMGNGEAVKLMMLLADPFSTPVTKMLPLFGTAFPGVPIIGGIASAGNQPGHNRILCNGRIMDQGAAGLVFTGALNAHCTVSQGCRPIGKSWVITRARRNVVQQLGGRPALDVVREMVEQLSNQERQLVQSHGLHIGRVINEYKARFGRGDFLIRGITGIDDVSGYIGVGDVAVKTGQTVQFHVRDSDTAREDLALMLEAQKLRGDAAAGILFSCNGRGTRLFDEPHCDARAVQQALGDIPLAGCFASGEIGPIGSESFVHGHTASLLVFQQVPAPSKTPDAPVTTTS